MDARRTNWRPRQLLELPVYRLLVNGNPDEAVDALDELLSDLQPVPIEA